jgi:hypothetical protein
MKWRPFQSKLAREITMVVAIKLVLLTLIWLAFFRGQHVTVDSRGMASALRLDSTQDFAKPGVHHDQQ